MANPDFVNVSLSVPITVWSALCSRAEFAGISPGVLAIEGLTEAAGLTVVDGPVDVTIAGAIDADFAPLPVLDADVIGEAVVKSKRIRR